MLFEKQAKAVALPRSGKRQNEPANAKSHLTSKAVKTKKNNTITGPKSRLFRNHGHRVLCNRTLQKLEVPLFRKHEISTKNYIAKHRFARMPLHAQLGAFSLGRYRKRCSRPLVSTHTPRQEQRTSCVDTGPNSLKLPLLLLLLPLTLPFRLLISIHYH